MPETTTRKDFIDIMLTRTGPIPGTRQVASALCCKSRAVRGGKTPGSDQAQRENVPTGAFVPGPPAFASQHRR